MPIIAFFCLAVAVTLVIGLSFFVHSETMISLTDKTSSVHDKLLACTIFFLFGLSALIFSVLFGMTLAM